MPFTSWTYLVFFLVVLTLHYLVPHRVRKHLILFASYLFYGWLDWRLPGLLLSLTIIAYLCAIGIAQSSERGTRAWLLAMNIVLGVGVLGFFKCGTFFGTNVFLSMGISFYTFQAIGYTVDVYRGTVAPCLDFSAFALYIGFFPKLIAGPIERVGDFLPQIEKPRSASKEQLLSGVWLLLIGLFKKLAIADFLAGPVAVIFGAPAQQHPLVLWMGVFLFSIQIYCDFSGYIDIARGSARLLGFELSENFRLPYLSRNITHFWNRWNITLSHWFRDYVFFPLGGIRGGIWGEYGNILFTMALVGLWHGVGLTFVVWGLFHGVALVVHRMVVRDSGIAWVKRLPKFISWGITFMFVSLCWIFFRAPNWRAATDYVDHLFLWRWTLPLPTFQLASTAHSLLIALSMLVAVDLVEFKWKRVEAPAVWPPIWAGLYLGCLVIGLLVFAPSSSVSFIYFQF
jgi:alginate O-acetyltransferase complex protein AlgI